MRTLLPVPERCTGCRLCLLACSFWHEEVFSEHLGRLRIQADEGRWAFEPIVCRQCSDAPCLVACPSGAISHDEATGAVLLDADACTGCRACVEVCRHGVIAFNEATGLVQLCDLCGGAPDCVASCPHGAIEYTE